MHYEACILLHCKPLIKVRDWEIYQKKNLQKVSSLKRKIQGKWYSYYRSHCKCLNPETEPKIILQNIPWVWQIGVDPTLLILSFPKDKCNLFLAKSHSNLFEIQALFCRQQHSSPLQKCESWIEKWSINVGLFLVGQDIVLYLV